MIKNIILTFGLLLGIVLNTSAQKTISPQEAEKVTINIIKKSKSTTSIISGFKQYKHLDFLSEDITSNGKLFFKAPNFVKWEYVSPFNYSVVFKNSQLLIDDDGEKSEIDLGANKAFKQLNDLIVRSVRGDMFDESQFEITYFKDDNYRIIFNPKDQNLKSFIDSFEIIFDKNTFDVLSVKMLENYEDFTLIEFVNQKFNTIIADEVFTN